MAHEIWFLPTTDLISPSQTYLSHSNPHAHHPGLLSNSCLRTHASVVSFLWKNPLVTIFSSFSCQLPRYFSERPSLTTLSKVDPLCFSLFWNSVIFLLSTYQDLKFL